MISCWKYYQIIHIIGSSARKKRNPCNSASIFLVFFITLSPNKYNILADPSHKICETKGYTVDTPSVHNQPRLLLYSLITSDFLKLLLSINCYLLKIACMTCFLPKVCYLSLSIPNTATQAVLCLAMSYILLLHGRNYFQNAKLFFNHTVGQMNLDLRMTMHIHQINTYVIIFLTCMTLHYSESCLFISTL